MKKYIRIIGIIVLGLFFLSAFPKHTRAQQGEVSFQLFYDQLSPYGDWVDYADYGYVWIPNAGPDFVPYSTAGYWVFTDYGWTWMSDYNWGWAPFHYGKWDYNNYYGWFWVPDNQWGPSWVNWRESDGYYGWSPMQPGISISFSSNNYDSHNDHWIFVRDRDFERPEINRYAVDRTDHERIIRTSTAINTTYTDSRRHTTYVSGPARRDVQNVLGRKIKLVDIQENTSPGQNLKNGRLQIYRPQVVKNERDGRKPAPWKVTNLNDAKRPMEKLNPTRPDNNPPSENNNRIEQPILKGAGASKTGRGWPEQPANVKPAEYRQDKAPVIVVPQNRNSNPVQPTQTQPSQAQPAAPATNNRQGQQRQMNSPVPKSDNSKAGAAQPQTARPAVTRRQERQEKAKESKAAVKTSEKPVNNSRKKQREEN